LNKLYISQ